MGRDTYNLTNECAENYVGVIARLSPTVRVINDREDVLWIVQRRTDQGEWTNQSYARRRCAVIEMCAHYMGTKLKGEPLRILQQLPPRHPYPGTSKSEAA